MNSELFEGNDASRYGERGKKNFAKEQNIFVKVGKVAPATFAAQIRRGGLRCAPRIFGGKGVSH
jgi:hypothetical protein